jgi:hypothetical protein
MFNNFFSYNRAVYEIMWKNIIEPDKPRWQYGACALYAAYLRLQTHTLRICNTCFSSATMLARKRFNVTSYVHCLSCLTSVSTQELHLIDPLAHWYRLFKIRTTTKWIDCSTSELFPLQSCCTSQLKSLEWTDVLDQNLKEISMHEGTKFLLRWHETLFAGCQKTWLW